MIEVLKQAKQVIATLGAPSPSSFSKDEIVAWQKCNAGLDHAIAEAEMQEAVEQNPDGVVMGFTDEGKAIVDHDGLEEGWVLYTHPQPKREPLTDEQIKQIPELFVVPPHHVEMVVRAIEAAHGIKE